MTVWVSLLCMHNAFTLWLTSLYYFGITLNKNDGLLLSKNNLESPWKVIAQVDQSSHASVCHHWAHALTPHCCYRRGLVLMHCVSQDGSLEEVGNSERATSALSCTWEKCETEVKPPSGEIELQYIELLMQYKNMFIYNQNPILKET